jgi:hypothetical protein
MTRPRSCCLSVRDHGRCGPSRPARYARQLLSHLGRRTARTTPGDTSAAGLADGTGPAVVGDGVLTLRTEAPAAEALAATPRSRAAEHHR